MISFFTHFYGGPYYCNIIWRYAAISEKIMGKAPIKFKPNLSSISSVSLSSNVQNMYHLWSYSGDLLTTFTILKQKQTADCLRKFISSYAIYNTFVAWISPAICLLVRHPFSHLLRIFTLGH